MHPPAIVDINGIASDGHIHFTSFGSAIQGDQATIPPDMRAIVDPDFTVNFGQSLVATFDFTVEDERVAAALRDMKVQPPTPVIGGNLAGDFNFDLARGRSAQTFP